MTTGVDTFTGTDKNDLFKASLLTVNDGDTLDGGTGTDTLNAEINANVTDKFKTSNIEKVNVTSYGTNSIDMKNMTGVEALTTTGSTNAVTLNNVGSATMAFGFAGSTTNTIVANHTAGVLAGTSDVLTVNLNTAKNATLTVNAGFESAKINVTGANDLGGFTAPGVSTLVLEGTGSLNANDDFTSVGTLTATGMTGALTTGTVDTDGFVDKAITGATAGSSILLGAGNDNIGFSNTGATGSSTIKLGAGDDKLEINAAGAAVYVFGEAGDDTISAITNALDSADIIDGGAGNDTLILAGSVNNNQMVMRSIENVTVTGSGTTDKAQDFTNDDSATAITFKAVDNSIVNLAGLSAGSTVKVDKATVFTGAVDTLNVTFRNAEAATTIDVNADIDGAMSTSKITAVTYDFAEAVVATTGTIATTDATSLTITAAKGFARSTIQDTDNKLTSVTITGSDAVTTTTIGAANTNSLATVNVSAVKALALDAIGGNSTKLDTVTLASTTKGITFTDSKLIGKTDNAVELDVTLSAKEAITSTTGTAATGIDIDSVKLGAISATSTDGLIAIGDIGANATSMGDITVSAKGNVTTGLIGKAAAAATSVGTISMTSTDGYIDVDDINVKDATGLTVNLSAKTFISKDTTASTTLAIKNEGSITSSIAGAAKANVNYTVATANGTVNLTATNTGGLASDITNNGTAGDGSTSTVSLGNAKSGQSNVVTFTGTVDTINVTGGTGVDEIAITTTNVKNGTISLGTGADQLSITDGANGVAINLGSTTVTFDSGTSNATTVAAGKALEYSATGDKKVIDNGFDFTVSGVTKFVGTAQADYIVANAEGTTITGGAGADKIVLNAGADTVVFASTAANNGNDTITGFEFGAGKDKLNLDAFLTAAAAFYEVGTAGTAIANDGVAATSTAAIALANIDKKVVLVTTADISTQVVDEATLFAAGKAFAAEDTTAYSSVLLVGETSGTDGVKVYYVNDGTNADDMTITLVSTLTGVSLADVHADNLA